MSRSRKVPVIDGMIWIETMAGNTYPVACNGRSPEEVAAIATNDLKQPCKVVKQGDRDDNTRV